MAINTIDRDIRKFAEAVQADLSDAVEKIAFDAHSGIVQRTPVDTGRARAGWDVTIGDMSEWTPPDDVDQHQVPKFEPGNIDGTQSVFIMNNLEYIEPLENGHSDQAPAGMVAVTIAEIVAEIDTILQSIAE